jgi:hypothetical protein
MAIYSKLLSVSEELQSTSSSSSSAAKDTLWDDRSQGNILKVIVYSG